MRKKRVTTMRQLPPCCYSCFSRRPLAFALRDNDARIASVRKLLMSDSRIIFDPH
jgi:hypothetical protein